MNSQTHNATFSRSVWLASAGSGKTFTLATRYIKLLALGADPSSILATTFTRKAAGEIRDRILSMLTNAATTDKGQAEVNKNTGVNLSKQHYLAHLAKLARNPHSLRVSTIDALLVSACQSVSIELGYGSGFRILDDAENKLLQSRAISEAIINAKHTELAALLYLVYATRSLDSRSSHQGLESAVNTLYEHLASANYNKHVMDFPDPSIPINTPQPQIPIELAEQLERCEIPQNKPDKNGNTKPNKRFITARDRVVAAIKAQQPDTLIDHSWMPLALSDNPHYHKVQFPTDLHDTLNRIATILQTRASMQLRSRNLAAVSLLLDFHKSYIKQRQQAQAMRFDNLAPAIESLSNVTHTQLAYKLDQRFEHILLDEFQDTSVSQYRFFEPLIEEIVAANEPRELFVVGDPKQSLYQWRDARPELMAELKDRIDPPPAIQKKRSTSYRTSQELLDQINQVFSTLTDAPCLESSESARHFERTYDNHNRQQDLTHMPGCITVRSVLPTEDSPKNTTHTPDEGISEDEQDAKEAKPFAAAITERCLQLNKENPHLSIGVLTRTNPPVPIVVAELRSAGLEAGRAGGTQLADHPAIAQVLALIRFAHSPGNTAHLALAASGPLAELYNLNPFASATTRHTLASHIRASIMKESLTKWLHDTTSHIAANFDQAGRDRLRALTESAATFERTHPTAPLDQFLDHAEQARYTDQADAPIQVMTIHQAKGLEFDCVLLLQADKPWQHNSQNPLVELAPRSNPFAGPQAISYPINAQLRALIPNAQTLHEKVQDQSIAQELCALYVALTRARNAVEVFTDPNKSSKQTETSKPSAAKIILQTVEDQSTVNFEKPVIYHRGSLTWHTQIKGTHTQPTENNKQQDIVDIKLQSNSTQATDSLAPSTHTQASPLDIFSQPRSGAHFGTVVHSIFEHLPRSLESNNNSQLQSLCHALAQSATSDTALASSAATTVLSALQHDDIRALLSPPPTIAVHREHRVAGLITDPRTNQPKLIRGIADRLHITTQRGTPTEIEIIDFKTDHNTTPENLIAMHANQLSMYKQALAASYRIPLTKVTATIISLSPPAIIKLPNQLDSHLSTT